MFGWRPAKPSGEAIRYRNGLTQMRIGKGTLLALRRRRLWKETEQLVFSLCGIRIMRGLVNLGERENMDVEWRPVEIHSGGRLCWITKQ